MSSAPTRDSPNKPDVRPSFRKPSNDGAHRKYRHHSPVDGSDSTSSGVSPKREQNIIRVNSLENKSKVSDDRTGKYHGKDSERDPGYSHSSRASNSHRYPEDKNSVLYSGRELRGGRSDHAKHDNSFERSKESRNADKNTDRYHSTDKTENSSHRSRGKDREGNAPDNRYSEKESSRAASGSWQIASKRDYKRVDEWDRHRERNDRDDRRIRHRSPSDYRKEITPTSEDSRRHDMDTFIGRESASYRLKESQQMEIDEQDYQVHKRRCNDRDSRKYKDKYSLDPDGNRKESDSFSVYQGREEKRKIYVDKNSNSTEDLSSSKKLKLGQSDKFPLNMPEEKPSSSKQVKEATEKVTHPPHVSTINHTESAQDLNAAKVAAMQAAELVNRNLVGTGFMSTDQKKKLLWGNKKNTSEESGTRWDLQLFDDRERQEKFNKLMSLSFLWPIVGCEGRYNSAGAQTRREGHGEAEGATDRLREAVHGGSAPQRWPHCRPRSVIFLFCFRTSYLVLQDACLSFIKVCNEFELSVYDFSLGLQWILILSLSKPDSKSDVHSNMGKILSSHFDYHVPNQPLLHIMYALNLFGAIRVGFIFRSMNRWHST